MRCAIWIDVLQFLALTGLAIQADSARVFGLAPTMEAPRTFFDATGEVLADLYHGPLHSSWIEVEACVGVIVPELPTLMVASAISMTRASALPVTIMPE